LTSEKQKPQKTLGKPHVERLKSLVTVEDEYWSAHVNWGLVLLLTAQPAEAAEHFRAAIRIDPSLEAVRQNLKLCRGADSQEVTGFLHRAKKPGPGIRATWQTRSSFTRKPHARGWAGL
jgi:hypothetical protein